MQADFFPALPASAVTQKWHKDDIPAALTCAMRKCQGCFLKRNVAGWRVRLKCIKLPAGRENLWTIEYVCAACPDPPM